MSTVYFISDLHLGHRTILQRSGHYRSGATVREHDLLLVGNIRRSVNKRDALYIIGDVAFDKRRLNLLATIPCKKYLVRGNHDEFSLDTYLKYFDNVYGFKKHKEFWLSHAPVHPEELRSRINIHWHVHSKSITVGSGNSIPTDIWDRRYINVCVEALAGHPISIDNIRNGKYWEIKRT